MKRLARLPLALRERLWRFRPRRAPTLSDIDRDSARLSHLPRPDFLIIGAPKCGTSWLQRALAQHPEIVVVPDEIEYFSAHLDFPLDWYLAHFARALAESPQRARRVVGEKSARYCSIAPESIDLVHRLLPEAKIILMTRDPVARHWSNAKRYFSKRRFNPREGGVLAVPQDELFTFFERQKRLSEFSAMIADWTSIYPARQFLVMSQEAALARPREAFDATLEHIGASRDYNPAKIKLLREETNAGPKVPMPENIRAHLESMFAAERERLRTLLGDHTAVYVQR